MADKSESPWAWKRPWKWDDAAAKQAAQKGFAPSRAAERAYERQLKSVAAQIQSTLKTSPPEQAEALLRKYAEIIEPWARQSAVNMVQAAQKKNLQTWKTAANRMGLDMRVLLNSPGIGEAVQARIAENIRLIKTIVTGSADKVAEITQEALVSGSRAEDIARRIQAVGEVSEHRARVIAHTEVSKAGTALTRARAADVGSTGYIWRTARDGDTRPSHRAMEGVFVKWDEPPVLDNMRGHAGEFPNCRCYPEPVIPRNDDGAGGVFKPPLPTRGSEHNAGGKVALSQWEKTTMPALETGATADPLEKALGIQRGKAFDMPVALRGANPNFSKGKEFQFNCQRCVPAYELRRRGYDVEAMPVASKNFGMVKRGDECFKDVKITGWPEDRKGLSETGLRARLETLPDGARVGVFVQWNKSSAHTFVCEKANGSLRFIDPQTGKACPEYLTQGKKFGYYRMDTLTLQEHIDWKTAIKAVPNDETGSKKYS